MTIQHTVVFRMNNGADIDHFFARARELATIGGVNDFEVLRQVGRKNEFTHSLSMYFDDQSAYDTYTSHPDHRAFVNDVWLPNVADFLELDYVRDEPRTQQTEVPS
jgi:Stress responsive A/B Barrel Domain